jgi:L-iditol 2-dehydrogenase
MKALLLTDFKQLRIADVPSPVVGEDDVLVRVRACGICGSDVHGFDGSSGRRIPPLVMGHEAAGEAVEVGGNVRDFHAGDRVTFDSTVSCGECDYCRRGRVNLCDQRMVLGVSCGDYRRHGAFAELVVVPQHIVYSLPDALTFEQAAVTEAVSVAVHAVGRASLSPDATALVVGSGMIGLLVVQVLRHQGCGRILAVDRAQSRLDLAKQLGADVGLLADASQIRAAIGEATGGRGVDVAFEVVGATEPVTTAVECTRKGGQVVLIGNLSPLVELPLQSVVTRELDLHGSCASSGEYPVCLDLLARGAIDVEPIISAVAPLEDGPVWFDRLYANEPELMKVILRPT